MWNDGIADISRIAIDKDVIIEYWGKGESSKKDANRGLPVKNLVDAGYTVVNASSALYYYRDQPSSYVMQVKGLEGVYGTWTMNSFYQNDGYTVPDASIRGGKVSIWQGGHGKVTDHEAEAWVTEGLRYGAQMFWNAKTPRPTATLRLSRRASRPWVSPPPTSTPRATPSPPASTRLRCPTGEP